MAITAPDIKLLQSERMSDTTDGGGRKTSRVIPDGVAGNIFPKVSRLDSVYGRVNLRKVYGSVQTADVDTYAGAHAAITDAPDNDKIHCTLFSTGSEFDTRVSARDRIESYVTKSAESRMVIVGRQLTGQQSVLVYQRVEEPLPEVGEVYCLSDEVGSVTNYQQYIRVNEINHEIRTFTDDSGDFVRRMITINTGVPLRYDFTGAGAVSRYSNVARQSKVRDTTVVDAARYYGIKKLTTLAVQNALELSVESVYTSIVPTTNRETPISNSELTGASNPAPGNASAISVSIGSLANGAKWHLTRGAKPGSVTISWAGGSVTGTAAGDFAHAGFNGTIDYESGVITRTGGSAGSLTAAFIPVAVTAQPAHTADVEITLGNRGTIYLHTCQPLPTPGTFVADFRALGKWYRLRDQGDGTIKGSDQSFGVGSIDYVSGAVVLTLGALPDVESSVIFLWGSPAHYEARTNDVSNNVTRKFTLANVPLTPGSVSIGYTTNSIARTATDDGNGVLTGTGVTGKVNYTTGAVEMKFTTYMPATTVDLSVDYTKIVPLVITDPPKYGSVSVAAAMTIDLPDGIVPGSLAVSLPIKSAHTNISQVNVTDNGSGLLTLAAGQVLDSENNAAATSGNQTIGTVNYTTGEVTLSGTGVIVAAQRWIRYTGPMVNGADRVGHWEVIDETAYVQVGSQAFFAWKVSGGSTSAEAHTETFQNGGVTGTASMMLDLTSTTPMKVVPGSIQFTCAGKTYVDINGTLYTDVSQSTGAGVAAGSVNYLTGEVAIDYYNPAAVIAPSVQSCTVKYGKYTTSSAHFRTNGSPIRPSSFYIQVAAEDGTLLTSSTDQNGYFTGSHIRGRVNIEMGVVRVEWGDMVVASGNELQPWYDPANVVGLNVWKPINILPDTIRYSCVVLTNLPLNADILGLDPVRLPMDGRVPIYRAADVVVIHNTSDHTLVNPVVAGATYSVGRTNLSELWLVDQLGVKVPSNQYIYSLVNGTLTMSAELNLTGLAQPLIAKHRVEDLALLSDVQINGTLTIASPLSREYPANTSYVSSALLFGDMNARVTNVHDIQAFSAWTDVPGTQATAQFNDIDYPIEILNNGGITERWRINFTSSTAYQVIGENLGVIATGTVTTDCAPSNALTGNPYFIIRSTGWGAGWSAGNQLRFNTVGAAAPIWIARTVLPGATLDGDSFSIQMRGDVDAA